MTPDHLLASLKAIATSLANRPQALALLALGSCGLETHRLDAFSDLDFFVIVEEHAKQDFIDNLDWLTTGAPLVFAHRNSIDGWKTLDNDGVFCEFAVFYPAELASIPFAPGRIVWARDGFDTSLLAPIRHIDPFDMAWTSTEALTNLLIGLKRFLRGEEQAAKRAISGDAAELVCRVMMAGQQSDPYNSWRRMEFSSPGAASEIDTLLRQGHLPTLANDLMAALAKRASLPTPLCAEIQRHIEACNAR